MSRTGLWLSVIQARALDSIFQCMLFYDDPWAQWAPYYLPYHLITPQEPTEPHTLKQGCNMLAWYGSMNRIALPSVFILFILAGGCRGEQKYVPNITLIHNGPSIEAVAEFHDLYPTFALLSGQETFGLDAPSVKKVEPSKLTRQVENEVLMKFAAARVFSRVTRFDPNPDVILSGRIVALHEHYRPRTWATMKDAVPYGAKMAQLLGLKTHVSSGEVHLTLFVLKSTGEVLGTYNGQSTFKETFTPVKEAPPGTLLNRALSDAVHQIQNELTHDLEIRKLASH
jgi:hypothetical protein